MGLSIVTAAATAAHATGTAAAGGDCSDIVALKRAYLACERAALSGRLAMGDIAGCSEIYFDLKKRAFGGEFAGIRAWYERATALEALGLVTAELSRSDAQDCG